MVKTIAVTLLAWLLVGYSVYASTQDCQSNPFPSNMLAEPTGYLYLNVFGHEAADTTYNGDTLEYAIDMFGVYRASIAYKGTNYNGLCVRQAMDSMDYRMVYMWSNDGVNWSRLDSSAAITDTINHNDSLIVRPYRYLTVMSYPSRNSNLWHDTSGDGSGWFSNTMPRQIRFQVTPLTYDKAKVSW